MKSDEFIREVDEEMQQEKLAVLWKTYGSYVITAAVCLVLGTAAKVGYDAWQASALQTQGEGFAKAARLLDDNKPGEAAANLTGLADELSDGPASVARIRAAEALIKAKDEEGARTLLRQLAGDGSADPLLSSLARLMLAQRRIDDADPQELIAELEPLATAESAWRHSARELIAIAALRAGDNARAIDSLNMLLEDATAPQGLKEQAREFLQAIGGDVE